MRILIATPNRNLVGGAETYVQTVLQGLLSRGHEVCLAYENPVNREREIIDKPEQHVTTFEVKELGFDGLMLKIDAWKPDVVYSQGLENCELEIALMSRYPTVLAAHNYFGTCGTGYKCHSFPQPRPCSRRFGPMCLLLHYPRRCGGLNPLVTLSVFRRQAQRKRALLRYRAIIVASAHMAQEFLQHQVTAEKLHVMPYPTPALLDTRTQAPRSNAERRLLFAARLTSLKGGHYLIRAISKLTPKLGPVTLTIAGDGPERSKLQDLATRLGVPTEFVGWVSTSERVELMRNADLLILPSVWPEPFGLVGIEAGSVGVPSVAYSVGGVRDWLVPGYSGELAPGDPPTVNGLVEAIVRALADPEHYRKLCDGAREVASRFTLKAYLTELERVLGADECHLRSSDANCVAISST